MSSKVETIRHSAAHVMAEAVQKLYPGTKVGIGPAIDDGFYYDFQFATPLQPDELPAIEKEMRRIIAGGAEFARREVGKDEARRIFASEPFKLELIEGLEDGTISVYEQDGFVDLCRGPHVANTREIRPDAFKLRSIAGAYWRGDEKRPMLTRIYAYAFVSKAELEAQHEPTARNIQDVRHAKVEAKYSVAMERCEAKSGNDEDVCKQEAKAARVHARSDASSRADDANADFAVAKEKCDTFSGDTRITNGTLTAGS
ncbi:MAG: hypothetical protein WCL50_16830, partial [Spirochaetota bacterium]